jgi:hypothetical protein
MSTASEIAAAIAARVATITLANDFATPIGTRVYRGKRRLDESAIPCAIILEGDDAPADEQRARAKIEANFIIEGHTACDPDNPNDAAHLIIADLKKALFAGDLTFGGKVRDVRYLGRTISPREDGMSTVAAAVEITVTYFEHLANP